MGRWADLLDRHPGLIAEVFRRAESLANWMGRPVADGQDAAQSALIRFGNKVDAGRADETWFPKLFRMVRSELRDIASKGGTKLRRVEGYDLELVSDRTAGFVGAFDEVDEAEAAIRDVADVLTVVGERDRVAAEAVWLKGLSLRQAANALGRSPEAIHAAIERVRAVLAEARREREHRQSFLSAKKRLERRFSFDEADRFAAGLPDELRSDGLYAAAWVSISYTLREFAHLPDTDYARAVTPFSRFEESTVREGICIARAGRDWGAVAEGHLRVAVLTLCNRDELDDPTTVAVVREAKECIEIALRHDITDLVDELPKWLLDGYEEPGVARCRELVCREADQLCRRFGYQTPLWVTKRE